MYKELENLKQILSNQELKEGLNKTQIPSLNIFKSTNTISELHTVYEPSLFVILKGSKIVVVNEKEIKYDKNSYLISSSFMPVSGKIIQTPFLSLQITFTFEQIFEAIEQFSIKTKKIKDTKLAISSYKITPQLSECVFRLLRLLDTPEDIDS
ncbi:MAG: AraC family transcriptional regulator, partial [Sphaerochaetaceae bacterium]|nr:AraC family transcriptional regulator [Sphaerochaetaceae bacterium]